MNFKRQLKEGLITQNPVLVQLLGMCSTMAITTSIMNGLGMGVSVLDYPDAVQHLYRPACVRSSPMRSVSPCFIVVIAGFVTCVDLLLQAFVPVHRRVSGCVYPSDRGQLHHPGPC